VCSHMCAATGIVQCTVLHAAMYATLPQQQALKVVRLNGASAVIVLCPDLNKDIQVLWRELPAPLQNT